MLESILWSQIRHPDPITDRADLVISNNPVRESWDALIERNPNCRRWTSIELGLVDRIPWIDQPDFRKDSVYVHLRKDAEERGLVPDDPELLYGRAVLKLSDTQALRDHYAYAGQLLAQSKTAELQVTHGTLIDSRVETFPGVRERAGCPHQDDPEKFYRWAAANFLVFLNEAGKGKKPIIANGWGYSSLTLDFHPAIKAFKGERFFNAWVSRYGEGEERLRNFIEPAEDAIRNCGLKHFVFDCAPYPDANIIRYIWACAIVYHKLRLFAQPYGTSVYWSCWQDIHDNRIDWSYFPRMRNFLQRDDLYLDVNGDLSDGEFTWVVSAHARTLTPSRIKAIDALDEWTL